MAGWYLTQELAPDTPGTQVFLAPGPEDVPLTPGVSPWIRGNMVRIPGRYWHRLLLALQGKEDEAAAVLDSWSGSADPDDRGEYLPAAAVVARILESVRHIVTLLRQGNVVTDAVLDQFGPYTREDMAAMLDAVMLVVKEAEARGEPFSAWPE
jgi:hypothetical protein